MSTNHSIKTAVASAIVLTMSLCAFAQPQRRPVDNPEFAATPSQVQIVTTPAFSDYFTPVCPEKMTKKTVIAPTTPDSRGFIRRWSLLDPITNTELRTNAIFNDSWLREEFGIDRYPEQRTIVPKDGQKTKLDKKTSLTWHWLDSKSYNVKLYRFAKGLGLRPTEAYFHAVTVITANEDMTVRMAVGSNSASMWWVNGEEAILLSGDRRMVVDDCVSRKITLHKGKNVVRGIVINGPGMSDFCIRFLDKDGKPVTNLTVSNE